MAETTVRILQCVSMMNIKSIITSIFFIKRGDTFQQAGRIQNLEESKALDRKIMNMLKEKIFISVYIHTKM